jgi:hypothetical protein
MDEKKKKKTGKVCFAVWYCCWFGFSCSQCGRNELIRNNYDIPEDDTDSTDGTDGHRRSLSCWYN